MALIVIKKETLDFLKALSKNNNDINMHKDKYISAQ
jgi:hypothetical protein